MGGSIRPEAKEYNQNHYFLASGILIVIYRAFLSERCRRLEKKLFLAGDNCNLLSGNDKK